MPELTAELTRAWDRYRATIEELRATMLAQPWADDPRVRAQAHYNLLQVEAAAFNLVIAPRPRYPEFYLHTAFQPLVYSYSLPASDFVYRRAILDGRARYRVWGRRNGSTFVDFQVVNVFYGGPEPRKVGNWDLDRFDIDEDGRFEILVSAQPRPGNWIALDPDSGRNFLSVREAFEDWDAAGVELHIDRVKGPDDQPGQHPDLDEPGMVERLVHAERYFRFIVDTWSLTLSNDLLGAVGDNVIYDDSFAADQGAANNPAAAYPTAIWRIGPDEALILESEVPDAGFWSVQLGDMWWQVLDFTYHQTSLNRHQAVIDEDGRFRAVVAHTDPGVPNWLDTLGNRAGVLIFRFFRTDRAVHPTMRKVTFADLRAHLPAATPSIDPPARAAALAARSRASRRRYGS
jgi:hypothetical protein